MAVLFDIIMVWYQNDWGLYGRRNEMLARNLSEHPQIRKIVHIEPPIGLDILKRKLKSNSFDDNLEVNLKRIQKYTDGKVLTFTPHLPGGLTAEENRKIIINQLHGIIVDENIKNLILWLYPPHILSDFVLDELGEKSELIISDCVDDHRKYSSTDKERSIIQKRYEKQLKSSDIVFSVSEKLRKELIQINMNIHHIPNATCIDNSKKDDASPLKPSDIENIRRPIVGYIGALSFRIDSQLLENLAKRKPNWNIVLIGTSPDLRIQHLSKKYTNIHLLGPKKYTEIDTYLSCFDVGIIPHVVNDITASMNPLKLYEYLKHGKPVVSTGVAGIECFSDVIQISDDNDEFISAVEKCIKKDSIEEINKRIASVKNHSWENRVKLMMNLINDAYTKKKIKERSTSNYYRYSRPEIQTLVPFSAVKILDVGCATGTLGKALKERQSCEVSGIECVQKIAEEAKTFLDKVFIGNIEEKIQDLPVSYFDCIIFADVLEHLHDPEKILSELKKCLAPNGVVIASIPNVRHWSVLRDLLEGRWDYADAGILDRTHLRFFTKTSLIQMFKTAGFRLENIQGTVIQGCEVPKDVIDALSSSGIDTLSLEEEGKIYQYLLAAKPEKISCANLVNFRLTSIIILTHNQVDYTKKCIEGIFTHTEEAFELIVVDNGSTDGTLEYLEMEALRRNSENGKRSSDVTIKIIKNSENLGFAAGNNQGIAAARGDYILLMNNDIVVTSGWLSRLLACAEKSPMIGIVGPKSNYVSGPQFVENVSYDLNNLSGLERFSSEFAKVHSGKATPFWRVVGFCMLIKRAVIDKIGGLDTRYGLGNFEDDDFSLRAMLAGYESRIAEDCFVHHFGNRTFIAARIDYKKCLNNNWDIFKEKWGIPKNVPYGSSYDLSFLLKDGFIHSKHYAPIGEITGLETSNSKETPPNSIQENYFEIQELIATGKKQEAKEALEKLLLDNPEFELAHNDLGVLYFQAGDKTKALKHYERAVALQPVNVTFLKNLADFYYLESGRVEDALQIYVNILTAHPEDVETLLITGHICVALEKFQDAKIFYSRVLEIEPGHQDALQFLDKLHLMNTGNFEAKTSEELYRQVQPLLNNGDPHKAIAALTILLERFPDFALAYNDLGVLYYCTGEKEKAQHHYEHAVELMPENINFQKNLADYYLIELDRKEDALQIYLNLLNHHPNDLEANLTAAHICVAVNKFNKAKELYKQVLVIDPENEDARNNLRTLDKIKGDFRADQQPKTESPQKSTSEDWSPIKETIGVIKDAPEKDIPQFSIIIPTSAPLKQIRRCVESIKKHTSESHEILFVNNGTTKGVIKWLRQCIDENRNCHLVKCGKGANPAVYYNTGLKAARGEYIVLLSNDVVVTGGWLSSMLQCFSSIPDAGMVGTMANRARGRQKVAAAANTSFTEINAFAESYRATNRYRRIVCDILDSFCLLFRRDLTEKIGLFDEQMGALGFEDEDYCLRATLEGYVNQIAGDVYLHRLERKAPSRSKKNFYLKWSGADVQSQTGKCHLVLKAVEKANRAAEEGKIDLAVELFLQTIGLLPEHRESYYKLAEMLVNTKRFQDALDVLNELPERDPDARQLALAACCKEGLDLLEEAEGYADRALELNRFDTSALNTKGIIAFRRDDKNAAESYFVRAMEIDPGFGEAYTNLGALKWTAGLKDEAVSLYECGFILSPRVPDIALNYHCALADLGEYQRAENIVRDAAVVHPRNKKIRYMLIDILLHQQNHEMAMQEIETAIADFGIDDGILSSALKIREKIGPLTISRKTGSRSTVSLCMIVKDEEEHLAKCLQSVRPVVDEIIVVDTGSRDRSRDIARVFGAKVFDFEWAGDFAEARNYSLSKANGKMVFVMDADEVISPLDYELFRQTAKQSSRQRSAFIINTRNYTMDNNLVGWVANEGYYDIEEAGTGWTPSAKIRLFPNESHIRFNFPVHEMVEPSLQKMGIAMKLCKFQVHHYGKLNRDKSEKKGETYYEIGCKKLEEMGDAPVALRELAIQAEGLKKHEEAIELWERFIAIVPNEPKAYINMGISYSSLGQFDKVLATAEKVLKFAPDSKEGHYNCALAKLHLGHPDQAIEILEKLCEKIPEYLPARFILAAAWCCREDKKRGMALLKELSGTTIGPGLAIRCHELASRFVLLQRPAYALALLNAAIDSQNANKDVLDLYADCLKRTDFHKKTGTYE